MTELEKKREAIEQLIKVLEPFYIWMGLPPNYLSLPEKSTEAAIDSALDWLNQIFANEFKDVMKIWVCQDACYWEHYRLNPEEFGEFREMVLLTDRIKKLKKLSTARNVHPYLRGKEMKKIILHEDGTRETVDTTPICGVDFCATCGHCLACVTDETVCPDGEHTWVQYLADGNVYLIVDEYGEFQQFKYVAEEEILERFKNQGFMDVGGCLLKANANGIYEYDYDDDGNGKWKQVEEGDYESD